MYKKMVSNCFGKVNYIQNYIFQKKQCIFELSNFYSNYFFNSLKNNAL
jgi:hypothetical protein